MARTRPLTSPTTKLSPLAQASILDQNRGRGPSHSIQSRFDNRSYRQAIRIGPQVLHISYQQNHV